MQRLTSGETRAQGPSVFDAVLPQPRTNLGFYRDIAVLAFKAPLIAADPATNQPAPNARLEIQRAVYGADGSGSAEVKDRLVEMIKSGRKSVIASSSELPGATVTW